MLGKRTAVLDGTPLLALLLAETLVGGKMNFSGLVVWEKEVYDSSRVLQYQSHCMSTQCTSVHAFILASLCVHVCNNYYVIISERDAQYIHTYTTHIYTTHTCTTHTYTHARLTHTHMHYSHMHYSHMHYSHMHYSHTHYSHTLLTHTTHT